MLFSQFCTTDALFIADFLVSEAEFMSTTTGWPSISGDTVANAQAFFDNLDVVCSWWTLWNWNDCDVLGPADLVVLVFQMDNSPSEPFFLKKPQQQ